MSSNAANMQFPSSHSSELPSQQPTNVDQKLPSSINDGLRKENSPQSSNRPKNVISAHEQGPAGDQDESLSSHQPSPERRCEATLKRPQEPSSDNAPSPKRTKHAEEENSADFSAGGLQTPSKLIATGPEREQISYSQWNPQTVPEYAKTSKRIPNWKRFLDHHNPEKSSTSRSLAPAAASQTIQETSDSEPYRPSPPMSPAPSSSRQTEKDASTLRLSRQPPPTSAAPIPGLHISQKLSTLGSLPQLGLKKHIEGTPDHVISFNTHGRKYKGPHMEEFNSARNIVEEGLIWDAGYNFRDGTWSTDCPRSFAEHNESGRIILVSVALMSGEKGEPNRNSYRWVACAAGMTMLPKIMPALVLWKCGMDLEIKLLTTKHNSDVGKLINQGRMEDFFQCIVGGVDDNKQPVERCAGPVNIERLEDSYAWSTKPRFMHKFATMRIPSISLRKTLGRIVDPNSLVAIAKAHRQGSEAYSHDLMKMANVPEAQKPETLGFHGTGVSYKSSVPSKVSTLFLLLLPSSN